ncbi:transcriptional regulator, MarR family [Pirellula staleyi DSM 6068]|uniref:Transcriptional regulator, MarR family n=1 Tax=Pirellula staleyi (strain ATCC 27377 / DSM 6068 / ICPB 4128) TaxID=530564 RepID=D2QZ48_PIRSD|nr:MarR family transcriptional regulator [Pirellula staleyi]ADB18240.1 transcriptional regulator, MarR family [Pirellula staleyi DSM 6068]
MLEHDFHDSIGCWVGMTARAFERALNEELAPHGITFQQWQVLAWLAFEGELSQAQLAQRLRVEAPTLVGILDRMERDMWIERVVAAGDRRKKLIRPMPKVKPVWERILAAARSVRMRATQGVSAVELEQVRLILERLRLNLSGEDELQTTPRPAAQPARDDLGREVLELTEEIVRSSQRAAVPPMVLEPHSP